MFLNICSHRFLSRSLTMAVVLACGVTLSSVAEAQMATGSGCTNCGASAPVVTYSAPAAVQYSQPVAQQSYPVSSTVGHSYSNSSCSGFTSAPRRCSSSRRAVAHSYRPSSSCGSTYTSAPVYSSSSCCSGGGSYSAASYPVSTATRVSTPVMQTGAGCPGGNCR